MKFQHDDGGRSEVGYQGSHGKAAKPQASWIDAATSYDQSTLGAGSIFEMASCRMIVRLSGHLAAVIDGVLHDTHDCSRDGTRCPQNEDLPDMLS